MKETKLSIIMRNIRTSRDILARDVAMSLGISPSYLSIIEKDKRPAPEDFISKLVKLLNLNDSEQKELAEAVWENRQKFGIKETQIAKLKREFFELLSNAFTKLKCNLAIDNTLFDELDGLIKRLRSIIEDLVNRSQPSLV